MEMLTPEPLEMKPHVYCTWRGVGVGGHPKVTPGAISLSTGGFVPFFLFPFILLNTILLKYQVLLFCFFFLLGARVPVGPEAIEENRLEETGSDGGLEPLPPGLR